MAVVTDSTAYLPKELADLHGIEVVPVQVVIAGHSYLEGVEISPSEVAEALHEYKPVSTSRPTPAEFVAAYRAAAERGASAVVSAHLSSSLSGTYESALLASRDAEIPVTVLDTRTIAMGLGYACIAAAEAADAGESADRVAEIAMARAQSSRLYFYVDTLEYLRRGGRIGSAAALLGNALRIKPLLHLQDGQVAPLEKARTANRALGRLADLSSEAIDLAEQTWGSGITTDVAVQHLEAPERAEALAATLEERHPGVRALVAEAGAVVAAHVGPGMVSVVIAPQVSPEQLSQTPVPQ